LWVAAVIARWPVGLTFGDELGYIGQARLILDGRFRPGDDSLGIWVPTHGGTMVGQYPVFLALLVAPLFAVWPRLIFVIGVLAALGLAWGTAVVLRRWGRQPTWALLVLAHPTVIIMARTVMVDLMLATFAVGAWCALRIGRRTPAIILLAATVMAKPNGFLIAFALLAGEAATWLRARDDSGARARLWWAALGGAAGIAASAGLNLLSVGKLWYGYTHEFLGTPPFWPKYFPHTAPVHIASLLLLPPLLVAGAWPLWRRRQVGPLFVVAGLTSMMCFFFFVDRGRTPLETLAMSPRLILPVVAFLMVGYIDLLAQWATRWPRAARAIQVLLVIVPAGGALAISARHRAWQEPQAAARAAVAPLLASAGTKTLGITRAAMKAGALHDGPVVMVWEHATSGPPVVLCGTQSMSYREPGRIAACPLPDYDDRELNDGFHALTRRRP